MKLILFFKKYKDARVKKKLRHSKKLKLIKILKFNNQIKLDA
jgi:hypothetical protein